MKLLYYIGILLFVTFEILNVYFIMPMPGSQEMNSISTAYFLYSFRWYFRLTLAAILFFSFFKTWKTKRKWLRITATLPLIFTIYLFNFVLVADHMFLQPSQLILVDKSENKIPEDRIVIGVEENGAAKAYPVEFLAYHHLVQDEIGGRKLIITYCSVCRTGRVFQPLVNGEPEKFRLVGMDHFNAMFEDESTGSWWRQVNGEAIAGPLTGKSIPEFPSLQMTLGQWLKLYPHSQIMQEDPASVSHYDPSAAFEKGISQSDLTGTNHESWKRKSWVIGIEVNGNSKAYDWNLLTEKRLISDRIGTVNLVLVLASDNNSFAAFENPENKPFTLLNDQLISGDLVYDLTGTNLQDSNDRLKRLRAYQEFWHSWQTFHPVTEQYSVAN